MAQTVLLHPERETAQNTDGKTYERLKNERATWFLRFQRYLLLGRNRSVQAVLDEERHHLEAQESTKEDVFKIDMSLSPEAQKKRAELHIVAIPGSWKKAVKQWRWTERAAAWDNDQLANWQTSIQSLLNYDSECTFAAYRVWLLNIYVDYLKKMATDTAELSVKERLACIKLSQSLMKEIAREMRQIEK